jgi:prepilin-type N-terminal cleavage/methylation domain-containing protein
MQKTYAKKIYSAKFMPFKRAFTLIELLIVIAIVAILSGFIFVSMNSAINSAKDAKIKADMSTIEKAVMEYSALSGGAYPALLTDLVPTYLGSIPSNPNGGSYTYTNLTTSFTLSGTLTSGLPWAYDSSTNAWGSGFTYGALKQKINIASTGNVAISGPYPVKLTINTQALIPAKLDSSCTALRFSDDPIATNLSYWIESGCNTATTIIWVNLPNGVAVTTGTDINMFYSPAATTAGSSGDSVFTTTSNMLFDHFDGPLDVITKWTDLGGTSILGSIMTATGASAYRGISSKLTFGTNYSVRTRSSMEISGIYGDSPQIGFNGSNITSVFISDYPTVSVYLTRNSENTAVHADHTNLGNSYTGYHTWEIMRKSTTNCLYYIDNTLVVNSSTYIPTGNMNLYIQHYSNGKKVFADWVLVRPYNSAELASSSANYVGSETTGQ